MILTNITYRCDFCETELTVSKEKAGNITIPDGWLTIPVKMNLQQCNKDICGNCLKTIAIALDSRCHGCVLAGKLD